MKGYVINNKCYIFPQEVGQIPSVEAEIIYVQAEDIKAWKEANGDKADKIKKYNYNVITVNPKEWSGHKDDELVTYYTITNNGELADLIAVADRATAGESKNITLVDPATYTFDISNKEKQSIYVEITRANSESINDVDKEYHQEGDYYSFTMPDDDIFIDLSIYNGYVLTVTVDGQQASSIEELSFLSLSDYTYSMPITDLSNVRGGSSIEINLGEGYSFNAVDTGKTHVVAKLNGTELDTQGDNYSALFEMPSENATLEITTTAPQS